MGQNIVDLDFVNSSTQFLVLLYTPRFNLKIIINYCLRMLCNEYNSLIKDSVISIMIMMVRLC